MEKQLKLYVGNLDRSVTESILRNELFGGLEFVDVRIVRDPRTGQSKGFGFVTVATGDAAQNLIGDFDGTTYKGKVLVVSYVKETTTISERHVIERSKQQESTTMSRRKAAKRNFKRNKDDDFNGPWR